MPQQRFKLILCDLGNVLINFDHRIAVRRILNFTDKNFDEVYQLFFDSPLTKDFEEGKIPPESFFESLKQTLGLKNLSFEEFVPIWNEIFFDNEGIVALLGTLKKKFHLHLISNINRLHYEYLLSKFPGHFAIFDRITLSCDVGVRKPAWEIYRRAIEEEGFKATETFYADDRQDLVEEASKFGIPSVVFKDIDDFKRRLKKFKIFP